MSGNAGDVALGIDVGGSDIALGLIDADGRPVRLERIGTEPWADALDRARESAGRLIAQARQDHRAVVGVGIGVPQLVDLSGKIVTGEGGGWSSPGLKDAFDCGAPVWIEADVRAAALAEALLGGGVGADDWLYVNLGTGISHSMVRDERPVPGSHGRAMLSGSTTMTVLDPATGRLVRGRGEDVASGRGLVERYRTATGRTADARDVLDRAAQGEPIAVQVRDDMIELLGGVVANLVDVLDPTKVVIGGGLATVPLVLEGVASAARSLIWFEGGRDLPIVRAALGADSGVIGAGLVARLRNQLVRTAW